jgi:glycosyltransferase involved in cell wall biosynthesis
MYFSRTLARANAVIAYSDYVASYFERLGVLAKPIHVIPNAVTSAISETDTLPVPDRKVRRLTIAYCGTVASHKGPHLILEALQLARLGDVQLLLLGDAPERNYVRNLRDHAATIQGLDLKIYGKYERGELALLLRGVDCVVMPSLVPEAGPIVPREALACGVPVVAARLGALPEVIREGENGFTFDPRQPQELAAILRQLAADPALVARLRQGARQTPAWGVKDHAERVLDVYDCALRDAARFSDDPKDISEFAVLHESVVRLGSDTSRTQTKSEGVLR